jgi:DNA replication licensing factor MCM5
MLGGDPDGNPGRLQGPGRGDPDGDQGGWDYGGDANPDEYISGAKAENGFFEFVRQYSRKGSSNLYRTRLLANCAEGKRFLEIELNDLQFWKSPETEEAVGEELVKALRARPSQYMPILEKALEKVEAQYLSEKDPERKRSAPAPVQLQVVSDDKPTLIRALTSRVVGKLVTVHGIVTQAAVPCAKTQKMTIQCRSCKTKRYMTCNFGRGGALLPRVCDGGREQLREKCPPNSWVIIGEESTCWATQEIKLQEFPEDVPVGEMPRAIQLYALRHLVDKVLPGTRLAVTGELSTCEKSDKRVDSRKVKTAYVSVVGLRSNQEGLGRGMQRLTPEDEEELRNLAKSPDMRAKLYRSVAPSIFAGKKDCIADVKKAICCLLFGGSPKHLPDETRLRGDINVLLLGDPGTAKSQFLKFVQQAAPIAVYTSGKGSSAAGLTAAIIRDASGNFALEGGAMVLADGGTVCIDEFDKMRPEDRVAIHEAMEQQTISIAKAGITTVLNTRCSVLAAANPLYGSWDESTDLGDQLDMATTILSRFDLIFLVKDVRDEERDQTLAAHVLQLHQKGVAEQNVEADIPVAKFRKYLTYMRKTCFPRISAAAEQSLENHYVNIRKKLRTERQSGAGNTIPITVRQLEALARISESFARMDACTEASVDHVADALQLFESATVDAANRYTVENPTVDDLNKIKEVEEAIKKRVPLGGQKARTPFETALKKDFDPFHVSRAIKALIQQGILKERGDFSLHRCG